jgi:hypothetical protein
MISIVSIMDDGSTIEVGTVGREGVVGAVVLFGAKSIPYQSFVQLPVHGYRVDVTIVKDLAKQDDVFRD